MFMTEAVRCSKCNMALSEFPNTLGYSGVKGRSGDSWGGYVCLHCGKVWCDKCYAEMSYKNETCPACRSELHPAMRVNLIKAGVLEAD